MGSLSKPSLYPNPLLWVVPRKAHSKHSQLHHSSFYTQANKHPVKKATQNLVVSGKLWNRCSMKRKERNWFYKYISKEKHLTRNTLQQWNLEPKSRYPQRGNTDLAVPVIAEAAIRPPAIQQSNCCCLWEHQLRICFSGCNLIVKASEVENGDLAGMPGRRVFVCESLNLQMPSASLLPSVFCFQEMYSLSMSKMRIMENQPLLKSQRFILRYKVNLRKIREWQEAEPFFLPSS